MNNDPSKERPILFSAPMVRAILDGNKTQTRRLVKPQPPNRECCGGLSVVLRDIPETNSWYAADVAAENHFGTEYRPVPQLSIDRWICHYGKPGDRLWVREAIELKHLGENTFPSPVYQADGSHVMDGENRASNHEFMGRRVHPSIHMPRWASRITLEITGVRVERLQSISEEDARAEGITDGGCLTCGNPEPCGCENAKPDARDAFIHLWHSIHAWDGPNGWISNPWVWVVGFKRVTP
jgi:hypothetical protein